MKEKIKIYITKELKELLLKDAKNFGFIKSNGDINQNSFLNTLILHYYEEYRETQKQYQQTIQSVLSESKLTNHEIEHLSHQLSKELFQPKLSKSKASETVSIAFKPTKASEACVEYIERFLLNDSTISSYYHAMFASYASLPQDKRELILFKDVVEKIHTAIQSHKTIAFTLNKGTLKYTVAPFKIAASHEELHNYILTKTLEVIHYDNQKEANQLIPFRLSKIENVVIHDQLYEFNDLERKTFERSLRNGVQFIYHEDDQEIKVTLKEKYGTKMFERFYVHRPIPIKIEGNSYYFDCSYDQIINYFARFGSNAKIEYPLDLKDRMKELHYFGYRQYNAKDEN